MLIEQLGTGYARDNLLGTFVLHEAKPYRIDGISSSTISLVDTLTNECIAVPHSILSGWKSLKFPRLGYRRLECGAWGWVRRVPRSYTRGLSPDNTEITFSEHCMTVRHSLSKDALMIMEMDDEEFEGHDLWYHRQASVVRAAMCPVYDKGFVLDDVLKGEALSFIPSSRMLVEKDPRSDKFAVHIDNLVSGYIDKDKNIYGPIENQKVIANMVRRYAD